MRRRSLKPLARLAPTLSHSAARGASVGMSQSVRCRLSDQRPVQRKVLSDRTWVQLCNPFKARLPHHVGWRLLHSAHEGAPSVSVFGQRRAGYSWILHQSARSLYTGGACKHAVLLGYVRCSFDDAQRARRVHCPCRSGSHLRVHFDQRLLLRVRAVELLRRISVRAEAASDFEHHVTPTNQPTN